MEPIFVGSNPTSSAKKGNVMKCSFCSKPNTEVKKMVAANDKIGICDECIMESLKILIYGEPEPVVIHVEQGIPFKIKV